MLDLAYLSRYSALPDARWESAVAAAYLGMERATGTRVTARDFVEPAGPVLYATNSTQKYDFLTFRGVTRRAGQRVVTVTKARSYHSRVMEPVLAHTGVIPLASRGYVLLMDAARVFGRRPSDEEYRACRDHLDRGTALPPAPHFDALQSTPRSVLGVPFDPSRGTLRDCWRGCYRALLGEALRFARESVAAGCSVHMYPEGTVSSRLGPGRIGAVMFAHALGVPIVPAGMSGCRAVFRGQSMALRGGDVEVRFGESYLPALDDLPAGFRAFDPDHEDAARPALQRATDDLMDRLDALLSPDCRRADLPHDGTVGTRRFV